VVARVAEPPFRCSGRFSSRITGEHLEAAPAPPLGHSDRGPLGVNRDLRWDRLSIVLAVPATLLSFSDLPFSMWVRWYLVGHGASFVGSFRRRYAPTGTWRRAAFAARRPPREPVELPERLRSLRHVESSRAPRAAGEMRRAGGAVSIVHPLGRYWQNISRNVELDCTADGGVELSHQPCAGSRVHRP
jgi:hypothetical protein